MRLDNRIDHVGEPAVGLFGGLLTEDRASGVRRKELLNPVFEFLRPEEPNVAPVVFLEPFRYL